MDKTCDFCKKEFSTLSNLRAHLKSSKKCISSRLTEDKEKTIEIVSFTCDYCNKDFSQKIHLLTHLKTCKVKINKTQVVQPLVSVTSVEPEINIDINNELIRLREENKYLLKNNDEIERLKEEIKRLLEENKSLTKENKSLTKENKSLIKENAGMKVQLENFGKAEEKKEEAKVKRAQKREMKQKDGYTNGKSCNITNNNTTNNNNNNNINITVNLPPWNQQFLDMTPIDDPNFIEVLNNRVQRAIENGYCAIQSAAGTFVEYNAVLKTSDNKEKCHYFITTKSNSDNERNIIYGDKNIFIKNIKLNEDLCGLSKNKYDEYSAEEERDHLMGLNIIPNKIFQNNYLFSKYFTTAENNRKILNPDMKKIIVDNFETPLILNANLNKYNTNSIINSNMRALKVIESKE